MRRALVVAALCCGCLADGAVSTSTFDQNVDDPDTVCGLPTQCNPLQCTANSLGGISCSPNPIGTVVCEIVCDGGAFCPQVQAGSCFNFCNDIVDPAQNQTCNLDCLNNLSVSCQIGNPR